MANGDETTTEESVTSPDGAFRMDSSYTTWERGAYFSHAITDLYSGEVILTLPNIPITKQAFGDAGQLILMIPGPVGEILFDLDLRARTFNLPGEFPAPKPLSELRPYIKALWKPPVKPESFLSKLVTFLFAMLCVGYGFWTVFFSHGSRRDKAFGWAAMLFFGGALLVFAYNRLKPKQ